jgi:hypothetical protein
MFIVYNCNYFGSSMPDLGCFSNVASHADTPKNAAAMMNVVEKPRKKDVYPENNEPSRVAIPTSALYTPKE